jgi:D-alanine-D-alanine ligase
MSIKRRVDRSVPKGVTDPEWWKTFFTKETGDLMFDHFVAGGAKREVDEILRKVNVSRDARILDLACGRGRHNVELAARGFQTVGLDYSKLYLAEAKRSRATLRDPSLLRFIQGDMRNLERLFAAESFDVVLSLFNSFGYFPTRSGDMDVLRQIAGALKPGGILVLGTISRSGVEHALGKAGSRNWMEFRPGEFFLDDSSYDTSNARLSSHWALIKAGRRGLRRFAYEQNVYSRQNLEQHLRAVGMRVERVWGRLGAGMRFRSDAWDMTLLARKRR